MQAGITADDCLLLGLVCDSALEFGVYGNVYLVTPGGRFFIRLPALPRANLPMHTSPQRGGGIGFDAEPVGTPCLRNPFFTVPVDVLNLGKPANHLSPPSR